MTTNVARLIEAGLTPTRAHDFRDLDHDLSEYAVAGIVSRAKPEDLQPAAYYRHLKQRAQAERTAANRTELLDARLANAPLSPLDELDARMDRLRRT